MLMEGVPPAMIENAAKMAGMPVGPLSLNDEVGIDLGVEDPAGDRRRTSAPTPSIPRRRSCSRRWSSKDQRFGRKNGKGFYDYPANGQKSAVARPCRHRRQGARSRRASASRTSRTASCSRRRWRRRAAWTRTSSPIRAKPTSARSSASASRPSPAARSRSSTAWARRRSSRARRNSRRTTATLRAAGKARPDGRARRDVLRDLRREAAGGLTSASRL